MAPVGLALAWCLTIILWAELLARLLPYREDHVTRRIYCDGDSCACEIEQPITVGYYIDPDQGDDCDEDGYTEAHFCSWACLTSWAMTEALDHNDD
jgi:hypothetical protein